MSNEISDLDLMNKISSGGKITSSDTGSSNSSNDAIRTLTEGTSTLHYGLTSEKKD